MAGRAAGKIVRGTMRPVSIGGSDRTLGGRTPGGRAARKRLSGGAHRRIVHEEPLQHAASLPSGQQLMPAEVVRASGESGASASRTPRSRIPRLIRAKNTPFRAGDARPGTRSGSGRLAPAGDHRLICTIPSFTLIRMRRLIPKRLAAWALAAAVFAAGAAPHRHFGLEDEGAGRQTVPERSDDPRPALSRFPLARRSQDRSGRPLLGLPLESGRRPELDIYLPRRLGPRPGAGASTSALGAFRRSIHAALPRPSPSPLALESRRLNRSLLPEKRAGSLRRPFETLRGKQTWRKPRDDSGTFSEQPSG